LYSFILHVILLALAFLFYKAPGVKEQKPLIAQIIVPEEPLPKKQEKTNTPRIKQQREKLSRMPRLPKDLPPPKVLSSVPAARQQHTLETPPRSGGSKDTGVEKSAGMQPEHATGDSGQTGAGGALQGRSAGQRLQPMEKLFDSDIIGKLAQKKNTQHDNGITFDTKDYKYYGYMQRLKERIESAWYYPREAVERGVNGDLQIRFTIRKDGRLGAVELVRTSGHKALDDAALKAIHNGEPYWPLPDGADDEGLTITGRFVYSLYGMSLR